MGFNLVWFHLDQDRFQKEKYICLTTNEILKIALTPGDINNVYDLLFNYK